MSNVPAPVVRSLIACEEIRSDDHGPRLSLIRIISTIRANAGSSYPVLCPSFAAFAILTNARGAGELRLEIRRDEDDSVLYQSAPQQVAFPPDPLALNGVSFRIRNLAFPDAGLYWVRLRYNGDALADLPIMLK